MEERFMEHYCYKITSGLDPRVSTKCSLEDLPQQSVIILTLADHLKEVYNIQMAPTEMAIDYYTYKPIKDKEVEGSSVHLVIYLSQGDF